MYFDPTYMVLVLLPTIIISGLAQFFIRSTYNKWGNTANSSNLNGIETAQQLKRYANIDIAIETVQQELGDHFDPNAGIVRLSPGVAMNPSVASMAVTAHELGHVQQHQQHSPLMAARNILVPALQFSPSLSYILILAGLFLGIAGLAWAGVALFGLSVIFAILTLPVEIDASRRALKLLDESGLIQSEQDRKGARQMLTAAAFTYIAAAISSVLTLLYYASLVSRRD